MASDTLKIGSIVGGMVAVGVAAGIALRPSGGSSAADAGVAVEAPQPFVVTNPVHTLSGRHLDAYRQAQDCTTVVADVIADDGQRLEVRCVAPGEAPKQRDGTRLKAGPLADGSGWGLQ